MELPNVDRPLRIIRPERKPRPQVHRWERAERRARVPELTRRVEAEQELEECNEIPQL